MHEEESRTWVLCLSPTSDCPVEFCGSEEEMEKAGLSLLKRYMKHSGISSLTVWTGYSWRKHGEPYCTITESGMKGVPA